MIMENSPEREWWENEGCKKLNDILINIEPDSIGWVPLTNLLPEVSKYSQYILFEIIKDDGKFGLEKAGHGYVADQEELFIYLD